MCMYVFFFSSRRRHTRYWRDWSSDVCSSDLLTSLSHFGLIVLGIFVFSRQGSSGAILYMVNHGLATALLFLVAGFLIRRTGTPLMSRMHGGVERVAPVLAGTFLVAGLAACGLPGLSPFVSEILVIISAFDYAWWAGAV